MSIIAIDSGATCSDVIIATADGNILFRNKYEALNFNTAGYLRTAETLSNIITRVIKEYKTDITCISAGIAGARFRKDRDMIKRELSRIHNLKDVLIYPDTEIALAAYFDSNEKNCGILIAGTGSVLYYRDNNGKLNRIGGWGRLIDDEGSGYWIGREALNRLTKYYDKRIAETSLVRILRKKYGLNEKTLIQKIYRENFSISSLAHDVCECAALGDRISKYILYEAAYRLAHHFQSINIMLKIGLCGSLFMNCSILRKEFLRVIKKDHKRIKVLKENIEPVSGAVNLALEHLNG